MGSSRERYYRFESDQPDNIGRRAGMFELLRDLRDGGLLEPADDAAARALVARAYQLHREPPAAAYSDGAVSWFLAEATSHEAVGLRALCADVVALLGRYGVVARAVTTDDAGDITYADDVQLVAVPRTTNE